VPHETSTGTASAITAVMDTSLADTAVTTDTPLTPAPPVATVEAGSWQVSPWRGQDLAWPLARHAFRKSIPFGPMLAVGAIVTLLYGARLNEAYLDWVNGPVSGTTYNRTGSATVFDNTANRMATHRAPGRR
jgi:hypothetical protein